MGKRALTARAEGWLPPLGLESQGRCNQEPEWPGVQPREDTLFPVHRDRAVGSRICRHQLDLCVSLPTQGQFKKTDHPVSQSFPASSAAQAAPAPPGPYSITTSPSHSQTALAVAVGALLPCSNWTTVCPPIPTSAQRLTVVRVTAH